MSQGILRPGVPVELTADLVTYDKDANTYTARGNVVAIQDKTTLSADSAIVNLKDGFMEAQGDMVFTDEGGNVIRGDSLRLNLNDKTAVIAKARLFFKKDNIHITGDEVRKTGTESYASKDATFTSCDCEEGEDPAWGFTVKDADVTMGEYLVGRSAYFNINGVPSLYFPYIKVPVKRERQTGFLAPVTGYSEPKGLIIDNSFFWARSRNTDATVYLDIETSRGIGSGLEYRYILSRKSYGEAFYYYFREDDIERVRSFRDDLDNLGRPEDASNGRWQFRLMHTEAFFRDITMKANINTVSDDEYFIDFGKTASERSLESLESNISFSKAWTNESLTVQFRAFNNLTDEDDSDTLQRLPEITFTGYDRRILKTPLYLSFEASHVVFARDEGAEGQRLDLKPRLSMPLKPGGYVEVTPFLSPRATLYYVTDDGEDDRYRERYLYEAGIDLTTTFARVFPVRLASIDAVKHTIRPKLSYAYIPEAVQDDLPYFDSIDSIAASNLITYSLNTTLTARSPGANKNEYLDIIYLDVSQGIDINEATQGLSPGEEREPLTDINAELRIRPLKGVGITAKGGYDVYDSWFNSYDASLSIEDKRRDALAVSHRFIRDTSRYFEASLKAYLTPPVALTFAKRISSEDEESSLETSYGIKYAHQCWTGTLSYTDKLDEKIVYLTFDLKGIGKVAGIEGKLNGI
jgi:LPS-assembly protein